MSLQLEKMKLIGKWTIPAATIQAATTGHAYWIDATGALVDAGASIAAANVTNQPPINFDVSGYSDLQWSLFYGAQTSNVGGKIGIAELWPSFPVDVVNTIPPYVRDVASHWLVTAGLGFVYQQSVPEAISVLYDVTSLANTALDTGILDTADSETLIGYANTSAGTSAVAPFMVDPGGTSFSTAAASTVAANTVVGWGPSIFNSVGAGITSQQQQLGARTRYTATTAGVGNTVRLQLISERKRPLRRPKLIAPYIQWVNPGTGGAAPVVPTAGSQPIYLQLWGRTVDGEVR